MKYKQGEKDYGKFIVSNFYKVRSFIKKKEIVSFIKLIIYFLICFHERQKESRSLYIYYVIFGPILELLLFIYAIILSRYDHLNIFIQLILYNLTQCL